MCDHSSESGISLRRLWAAGRGYLRQACNCRICSRHSIAGNVGRQISAVCIEFGGSRLAGI